MHHDPDTISLVEQVSGSSLSPLRSQPQPHITPGSNRAPGPQTKQSWAARRRSKIIASLGGRCQCCTSTHNLQLHVAGKRELKHHGAGSKQRASIYTKLWREGRLRLLCQMCHTLLHKGGLTLP